MFVLLKFIIWTVGAVVVFSFILNFFGYRVEWNYLSGRRAACAETLSACAKHLLYGGTKPGSCQATCLETEKLLRKVPKD